jgi:hypothetical protein
VTGRPHRCHPGTPRAALAPTRGVLAPAVQERFADEVRAEIRRQFEVGVQGCAAVESEQRNLARAVATAGDIPELVAEMRQRGELEALREVRP